MGLLFKWKNGPYTYVKTLYFHYLVNTLKIDYYLTQTKVKNNILVNLEDKVVRITIGRREK